ncbi:MAG: helix-turn-helix domain-containing protein [Gemmataceae bacterium]|nr:helix-turn-helix domain-containing protein [Gemmataceae bacterium]
MATDASLDRALSVRQLARRWAVSPKKVRAMLKRGIIRGFDVGVGRTQIRISPEAVKEAEQRLAVQAAVPRRKRRNDIDPEVVALLEA